jgi:hypothetical protein
MVFLDGPRDFDDAIAVRRDKELGGVRLDGGGLRTRCPCVARIAAVAKAVDGHESSGTGGAFTGKESGEGHDRSGQE